MDWARFESHRPLETADAAARRPSYRHRLKPVVTAGAGLIDDAVNDRPRT